MSGLFFYLFATVAAISAVMTITRRDAVTSAFWLIFCFLNVAALFATLQAHFIAVLQVLIYAGAIMVFFLFVTMFLGRAKRASAPPPILPFVVGLGTVAGLLVVMLRFVRSGPNAFSETSAGFGSIETVSRLLLSDYLFAFELTGLLLTVAVIGAVLLARREAPGARATRSAAGAPAGPRESSSVVEEVADA